MSNMKRYILGFKPKAKLTFNLLLSIIHVIANNYKILLTVTASAFYTYKILFTVLSSIIYNYTILFTVNAIGVYTYKALFSIFSHSPFLDGSVLFTVTSRRIEGLFAMFCVTEMDEEAVKEDGSLIVPCAN